MNATRLPAHHRRILAQHLNIPEAELDKALARRREAGKTPQMTRPSPYAGSAYVSTNYNQPIIDMGRYQQVGARKSDAEHQATADRLIAEMLQRLPLSKPRTAS